MKPNPSFWAGKRVCVTGGTGFLGYHLVRQLVDLHASVRVFALELHAEHAIFKLRTVETTFGDVRDAGTVRRAVAGCDVVFHTAGNVAVWGGALKTMHAVHIDGTRNVLAAAPPLARIVHTSSLVAVGAALDREPVTEDSAFSLDGLRVDYVHAKRAAEQIALSAAGQGRHVVITNPGYLIGPEDYERSVMGRFCERFWRGRLLLAPPGGWNLVDVRDVAEGHLLAAEHGASGRRYLLCGENHTIQDFMKLLAEAAGLQPRILPTLPLGPLYLLAAAAMCRSCITGREPYPAMQHVRLNRYYWYARSDRAWHELGWQDRPIGQSLAETFHWYESRRLAPLRGLNRWWLRPDAADNAAA